MDNCGVCRYFAQNYWASYNFCASCQEGFKATIAFMKEADDGAAGPRDTKFTNMTSKDFWNGLERMNERDKKLEDKNLEEKNLEEKVSFLNVVSVLSEGILTDILVKPRKGKPIPAHRALLAAKSKIFRTMLLVEDTISLPELSHNELKCLLDFLYTGTLPALPDSSFSLYSLLYASAKYDIPFLRKQCRHQILAALHTSNALDALEASQLCFDLELKQKIINLIVDHAEEVVSSAGYEVFARRNAHLAVDITRALLTREGGNATSTSS